MSKRPLSAPENGVDPEVPPAQRGRGEEWNELEWKVEWRGWLLVELQIRLNQSDERQPLSRTLSLASSPLSLCPNEFVAFLSRTLVFPLFFSFFFGGKARNLENLVFSFFFIFARDEGWHATHEPCRARMD